MKQITISADSFVIAPDFSSLQEAEKWDEEQFLKTNSPFLRVASKIEIENLIQKAELRGQSTDSLKKCNVCLVYAKSGKTDRAYGDYLSFMPIGVS